MTGIGEYNFTKPGINEYVVGITAISDAYKQIGITKSITFKVRGRRKNCYG